MSDPAPGTPSPVDPASVDVGGMLEIVRASPAQWTRALEVALADRAPARPTPRAVIVGGMGGSGIAGDVARAMAERCGRAPLTAVKGYRLPAWAGPDTPLLAVSHSGNTEETLALVAAALEASVPVHAITTGGALGELAADGRITATHVDGGLQPRASLPSLVTPTLVTLEQWGVLDDVATSVGALPAALTPLVEADRTGEGWGVRLAPDVVGTVPVFLGGRGVGSLVALRGAGQIAENAEEPAFHAEIPEFDHNALVGFATKADEPRFLVIAIRDSREHPRIAARFAPTLDGMRPGVGAIEDLLLPDGDWLTRLACGILEVDLLSVHLAVALQRDPTPVDILVALKQTLAETP